MGREVPISRLVGRVLTSINGAEQHSDQITLHTADGAVFRMYHHRECCESVAVAEVIGDVSDLIGTHILVAEKRVGTGRDNTYYEEDSDPVVMAAGIPPMEYPESWTWTFYEFQTIKGSVTMRWLGESNGYYSEAVDFELVKVGPVDRGIDRLVGERDE